MRSLKISIAIALLLGTFTQLSANESVVAQIKAIKTAKSSERRELINTLKLEIAQMNKQEQSEAVKQMRTQLQTMNHEKTMTAEQVQNKKEIQHQYKEKQENKAQVRNQEREQKRIKQMSEDEQMQQVQNMNQIQNMHQHQGANQFSQEIIQSNPTNQSFGQKK